MSPLTDLAGGIEAGVRLLTASFAELDGPALDNELRRWAHPDCGDQAPFLFMVLRDAVDRWWDYDNDPQRVPGWSAREVDGEVLGALWPMVRGSRYCPASLDRAVRLSEMHPGGETGGNCPACTAKAQRRHLSVVAA